MYSERAAYNVQQTEMQSSQPVSKLFLPPNVMQQIEEQGGILSAAQQEFAEAIRETLLPAISPFISEAESRQNHTEQESLVLGMGWFKDILNPNGPYDRREKDWRVEHAKKEANHLVEGLLTRKEVRSKDQSDQEKRQEASARFWDEVDRVAKEAELSEGEAISIICQRYKINPSILTDQEFLKLVTPKRSGRSQTEGKKRERHNPRAEEDKETHGGLQGVQKDQQHGGQFLPPAKRENSFMRWWNGRGYEEVPADPTDPRFTEQENSPSDQNESSSSLNEEQSAYLKELESRYTTEGVKDMLRYRGENLENYPKQYRD